MTTRKPKLKKPKLRKGETVWWTIERDGILLPRCADKTKKEVFDSISINGRKLPHFHNYKPVKIIVRPA